MFELNEFLINYYEVQMKIIISPTGKSNPTPTIILKIKMMKIFIYNQEKLSTHIFKITFYQIHKAHFKIG